MFEDRKRSWFAVLHLEILDSYLWSYSELFWPNNLVFRIVGCIIIHFPCLVFLSQCVYVSFSGRRWNYLCRHRSRWAAQAGWWGRQEQGTGFSIALLLFFLSQNLVRSNYRSDLVIVSSTLPPSSMATDSRARRLSSSSTLVHISVFFSFIDAPRLFFYMAILVIQYSIVLQDNRSFPVEELGRQSLINAKWSVCPARSSDRKYFLHFVSVFHFVSS